jgi:hypothetical protein
MFSPRAGSHGARITKYLNKYVFLLLTWSTGPMEWSTGNSYKAEALTNVLRYHTRRSSQPEDRKLCVHTLPVPMAARITKYLNKYVRTGLCLIYISSFYFWSPPSARKMRSYKAEALTNVLRYHTRRSSQPEDRKLPITELKWDARTVTNIPGNTAHCCFITIPRRSFHRTCGASRK